MSRIPRMLFSAVFVIALCGIAASAASAVEDPFYKLENAKKEIVRLKAGETREVGLEANTNTVLSAAGVTITCTKVRAEEGATINGSEPSERGTSIGWIIYSGCTVAGNGEPCIVSNGGVIETSLLTGALVFAAEMPVKGTKILDLFKPAFGNVFAEIKFEGLGCKVPQISVQGSADVEILNSKKEVVAYEEHESAAAVGFIKILPNGTKECDLIEGKFNKCTTSSIKAVGVAATLTGTSEVFLGKTNAKNEETRTGLLFGAFTK